MELIEFIIKHPHPNPPPSRGREYLYKSPLERGVGVCYPPSPGGRGEGRGIKIAQFR